MNKYVAIVKDSFREALASRILWILLALITLLLLALAPFGYQEVMTTRFVESDIQDPVELIELIREEGVKEASSPSRRIWTKFDEELRGKLLDLKPPGADGGNPFEFIGTIGRFRGALSDLVEDVELYDEEAWRDVQMLSAEGRDLIKRGVDTLNENETHRLNRLLLEAAYPDLVKVSRPTSIRFTYLWMHVGPPQPLSGNQLKETLEAWMAFLMKWFVGAIGVFVAILVTAPVIPQMFESGSLHLLLSKPISRWLVFLAKYFGGWSFILIGAVYLIGGLWLILGVRFGVWDPRMLASIPIYLFMFAIYYAVSALAGVIWRSATVSIAISILFWLICFCVGTVKVGYENQILNKVRLAKLIQARDTLIGVNEMGFAQLWDEEQRNWKEVFVSPDQQQLAVAYYMMPTIPRVLRPVGPIYDENNDRLMLVMRTARQKLVFNVGRRDDKWESAGAPTAPPMGTVALLHEPDGKILVASSLGLFRIEGDLLEEQEAIELFGLTLPFGGSSPLRSVGPDPTIILTQPADASLNASSGEIALYSRGRVKLLRPNEEGKYDQFAERELDEDVGQPALIAFGGTSLLWGGGDGEIVWMDAKTLEQRGSFRPEESTQPRFLESTPGGLWMAALFHNGRLHLFNTQTGELSLAGVLGQGDISAVCFAGDDELLVADRTSRVTRYSLPDLKVQARYVPQLGVLEFGHRYIWGPIYTVFPKPGELDKTFDYLLSGKKTKADRDTSDDLEAVQTTVDPWGPVWSSALFTLVVLAIACFFIERAEF